MGVVEFCGSDFKYVLGVLCKYNDLPCRYQDKGYGFCIYLFVCVRVLSILIFVESNMGWEGLSQCRALVRRSRFDDFSTLKTWQ